MDRTQADEGIIILEVPRLAGSILGGEVQGAYERKTFGTDNGALVDPPSWEHTGANPYSRDK